MANNTWSNYTEKTATPVDADEVMVRDSTDGKNKRLLFGTFWKWVAKKLNEATISELQTDNKTIIGAINALNSDPLNILFGSATSIDYSFDYNDQKNTGVYYLNTSLPAGASNRPADNCTNCYLLVIRKENLNRITQIVLPGNLPYIYYRSQKTDSNNWHEWKAIK